MRTFVESPSTRRATLSIKHSYVKVFLNGVPVIASANWWSSDWNVQVELVEGLNLIEVEYVSGRGAQGHAPVYLFDPLGRKFTDLRVPVTENEIKMMALGMCDDDSEFETRVNYTEQIQGEGYVMITRFGYFKLVNRREFSYQNFINPKFAASAL